MAFTTSSASPSAGVPRQIFLDALRGFALLGILMVNIVSFASPYYGSGLSDPMMVSAWDRAVSMLISTVFETKFYLLFSFLFGYSFTIQIGSAQRRQQPFAASFFRRLLGLWLIGLAHAVLLYHGDILTTYAMVGVVLYFVRARSERFLLTMALGLVLATSAWWLLLAKQTGTMGLDPVTIQQGIGVTVQAFQGGVASVVRQHVAELLGSVWMITIMMQAPMALAMFCLGLMAGRRQVFLHLDAYQAWFRQARQWGLAVGAPVALLYGWSSTYAPGTGLETTALALSILTGPLLSMAYIGLAVALYQSRFGLAVAEWLAPAGRMALSNYLWQSLVCSLVFFGPGLGLIGQLSPVTTFCLAVALFLGQLGLSHYWLRYCAYGPVEWGLRMWSYGRYTSLIKNRD